MRLDDFDYDLPEECIAQRPTERRDAARLLVHEVDRNRTRHETVAALPELLEPGDLLVVNDTRVLPARIYARRESGAAVELLLLRPDGSGQAGLTRVPWRAMANPARRLKPGEVLALPGSDIEARLLDRPDADWRVDLVDPGQPEVPVEELLERVGRMPLPPYIARGDRARRLDAPESEGDDRERYQTVYATEPGAIAAPTAGLHFTPELLSALDARGVRRASVTLHVGAGTFLPVKSEDPREHKMHTERYVLPEPTVSAIAETRAAGGRVLAVGTTSLRVLESCVGIDGELRSGAGETRLFILPGAELRVVDALLTNFHLPKSTLLMLVSAIAGRERILGLYAEAIDAGYRFYSYGDAMLLLRN